MSKISPSIPKGMRDFSPVEVARRRYIMQTMRATFERFGYQPIETPTMENRITLTGKYGEEGDRLIFNVLNSGDYMSKADGTSESRELTPKIADKALRYDLTVPFARYVVQHRNDITFPFKRYQIQPVWRADRPQKGRYREFWQCDADVIGSNSLLNEIELLQMMRSVFDQLGLSDAQILVNNRKLLEGLAEQIGAPDKLTDLTVAMDKLDKIGVDKVKEELEGRGFSAEQIETAATFMTSSYEDVKNMITTKRGKEGITELETVLASGENVTASPSLARGLDYYTGTIMEAKASPDGLSIAGGGRYDDLTSIFGLDDVSGVGFSFGLDRIYNVLEEANLFPADVDTFTQLLFACFDQAAQVYAMPLVNQARAAGIAVELYPDAVKLAKQMKYADANNIPFVVVIGGDEMESGELTFKDMASGDQSRMTIDDIINKLK